MIRTKSFLPLLLVFLQVLFAPFSLESSQDLDLGLDLNLDVNVDLDFDDASSLTSSSAFTASPSLKKSTSHDTASSVSVFDSITQVSKSNTSPVSKSNTSQVSLPTISQVSSLPPAESLVALVFSQIITDLLREVPDFESARSAEIFKVQTMQDLKYIFLVLKPTSGAFFNFFRFEYDWTALEADCRSEQDFAFLSQFIKK